MAITNHSKRPAWAAERMEKQVKKRLGITRHKQDIVIKGVRMAGIIGTAVILRERWIKVPMGGKYHFAVKEYQMVDVQGRLWSCKQAQAHDASHGYVLSVTGFWGLTAVPIPVFTK